MTSWRVRCFICLVLFVSAEALYTESMNDVRSHVDDLDWIQGFFRFSQDVERLPSVAWRAVAGGHFHSFPPFFNFILLIFLRLKRKLQFSLLIYVSWPIQVLNFQRIFRKYIEVLNLCKSQSLFCSFLNVYVKIAEVKFVIHRR